jgi:hypothetical protein
MFYVGVVSSFKGKADGEGSQCAKIEKLGSSQGRAKRFLNEHKPVVIQGVKNRACVFVLPNGFRLRNDLIGLSIRQYKCDWTTAKFHIYREAAQDVVGNKQDWAEFFPEDDTATPPGVLASPTEAAAVQTEAPEAVVSLNA